MYLWGVTIMINNEDIFEQDTERELPKNVRQIGEVQKGYRIYIEDYAYTYLHQFAAHNKKEDQIAFLIGEQLIIDEENVILIQGVIKSEYLRRDNANVEITSDTLKHLYEIRKHYFNRFEIIGWAYTQPEYGVLLTSYLINQHNELFDKEGSALFVLDPIEKEENFFVLKENELVQSAGFFIYYEKNLPMHEYMLDYKVVEDNIIETKVDEAVQIYRFKEQEKKEVLYHKRFVNMLFALSGALVIMCILIGVGLINNMEEMNNLKKSFGAVVADYSVLKDGLSKEITGEIAKEDDTIEGSGNEKIPEGSIKTNTLEEPITEANLQIDQTQESEVIEVSNVVETEEKPEIPEYYTVKPGDNLIRISYHFYSTKEKVEDIQALNGIDNPHKIYVGQKILLPQ